MEKYIALAFLILLIYITAQFWLWLYGNMIWISNKKNITIYSLAGWFIAAGLILFYPQLLTVLSLDKYSFVNQSFNLQILWIFVLYINSFIILFNIILRSFNKKALLVQFFLNIYFITLVLVIYYLNQPISWAVVWASIYYMFISFWEELSKSQIAFSINEKKWTLPSDILLFHILAWVGFAFWENIVYTMSSIDNKIWFFAIFISGLFLVIVRWLIWFWVHTIYSSFIWYAAFTRNIAIWCLLAFILHYWYDLILSMGYSIVIIWSIILWYFWVSYMFYQIDRIYIWSAIK